MAPRIPSNSPDARDGEPQQGPGSHKGQGQCDSHDPHGGHAVHDRGVDLGAGHQAEAVDREDEGELVGGEAVVDLEHERRADHVADERPHGQARDDGEREEVPVSQQRAVTAQGTPHTSRRPPNGREGLGEPAPHGHAEGEAECRQDAEHRPPPGDTRDEATHGGREQGGDADDEHEAGDHPRGRTAREAVADDSHRGDSGGGVAHALDEAQRDEHADRGRQHAQQRRDDVQGDASQCRSAAAEAIGHRPHQELPNGSAEQHPGDGQRDRSIGGSELSGDGGQRRQVHVDSDCTQGRHGPEQTHEGRPERPVRSRQ